MATADPQQLRALVGSVVQQDRSNGEPAGAPGTVVAVRAEPTWTGSGVLDGPTPIRVVPAPSPLAVRAALVDHADRAGGAGDTGRAGVGEVLVILTPCSEAELGLDVLARLVKRRVVALDPYSAASALFGATLLDPTLVRDDAWLLEDLIELAPAGGWPDERPINGVLDAERAWRVWHAARFAGERRPDTIAEVLQAGDHPTVAAEVSGLDEARRAALAGYWAGGVAPVDVLIDIIAAGGGSDLVALGLVADVLWATTDDPALAQLQTLGRARLEPRLGRDRLGSDGAQAWAAAATELVDRPDVSVAHLDRAEEILGEAGALDLAVLSDRLAVGFEQRLDRLGTALSASDLEAAETVLDAVRRHRLAASRRGRIASAHAAVRLLRRELAAHNGPTGHRLAELAVAYAADGAWVDEARRALTDGELAGGLPDAYGQLLERVDQERRAADRAFAPALAEWSRAAPIVDDTPGTDAPILPLENVLDQVVAPIATDVPVLVLVCDGMGLPVAHELLRDLASIDWMPAVPPGRRAWPAGVAVLPTVTEVSRTSLLSGTIGEGGQPEEGVGFTNHRALRHASSSTRPPVLFHKGQLTASSGRALPEDVRATVADPARRVVGVVVNAVDDHLSRGQQVRVDWGLASLRPLEWLLDAAQEAGRVVVLTADHGHVVHGDGAVLRPPDPETAFGERWRVAPPPPADDEVEVAGPRVAKGGRVVLPADERLRYGGHKHGYHGGATPQEVLVPVIALARTLPEGWSRAPLAEPVWWTRDGARDEAMLAEPERTAPAVPARPAATRPVASPQPSLFEPEPESEAGPSPSTPTEAVGTGAAGGWVDRLLASPAFESHQRTVRLPRPVPGERIAGYLRTIAANGGEIPLATLAARLGEPVDQVRLTLTMVQRLVNIDGAEILALRADATVSLNAELAALQFEIDLD